MRCGLCFLVDRFVQRLLQSKCTKLGIIICLPTNAHGMNMNYTEQNKSYWIVYETHCSNLINCSIRFHLVWDNIYSIISFKKFGVCYCIIPYIARIKCSL